MVWCPHNVFQHLLSHIACSSVVAISLTAKLTSRTITSSPLVRQFSIWPFLNSTDASLRTVVAALAGVNDRLSRLMTLPLPISECFYVHCSLQCRTTGLGRRVVRLPGFSSMKPCPSSSCRVVHFPNNSGGCRRTHFMTADRAYRNSPMLAYKSRTPVSSKCSRCMGVETLNSDWPRASLT